MPTSSQDTFFTLAERYSQLGRLLPSADDFDTDNEEVVAEANMVLAEMKKVKDRDGCSVESTSGDATSISL